MAIKNIMETKFYKLAFDLAMKIFEISRSFPGEEMYSLSDQIRRASKSVCTNLSEISRKRQYPLHFISKASDADMENCETQTWIQFALACKYISQTIHDELMNQSEEVGKLIHHMSNNPEKY